MQLQSGSLLAQGAYDTMPVRVLAQMSGLKLGGQPTPEEIQALYQAWGPHKVFDDNIAIVRAALQPLTEAKKDQIHNALASTGAVDQIPLRDLRGPAQMSGSYVVILTGGKADLMMQRVHELKKQMNAGLQVSTLYIIAGERTCDTPSELENPHLKAYVEEYGELPNEGQLLSRILHEVIGMWQEARYLADELEDQARQLITALPMTAHAKIYVPVATGSLYTGLKIRRVIREEQPVFDEEATQFHFSQASSPLGSMEQLQVTPGSQNPYTLFSGLVRLIDELSRLKQ